MSSTGSIDMEEDRLLSGITCCKSCISVEVVRWQPQNLSLSLFVSCVLNNLRPKDSSLYCFHRSFIDKGFELEHILCLENIN